MIDKAKRGQRKVKVKEVTLICSLTPNRPYVLLTLKDGNINIIDLTLRCSVYRVESIVRINVPCSSAPQMSAVLDTRSKPRTPITSLASRCST